MKKSKILLAICVMFSISFVACKNEKKKPDVVDEMYRITDGIDYLLQKGVFVKSKKELLELPRTYDGHIMLCDKDPFHNNPNEVIIKNY